MCHASVVAFGVEHLHADEIGRRKVLEVGARVVESPSLTLRHHVEALGPELYLGIDIEEGTGVDEICDAERLRERFGSEVFDVVISTEVLEHVRNWCLVVSNLKHVVKPGGVLLLTTRSFGFPYHPWPYDFWRYEKDDMRAIFSDMDILVLESDPQLPGVLMKALKPQAFVEVPPQESMYSVILGRRARYVSTVAWRTYVATVPLQNLYRRAVPEPARVRINRVFGRKTSS